MLGFFCLEGNAALVGECEGTPIDAVKELPNPLSEWGVIACTPYGHIISNKEGWIWSNPGGYSPVMIPSQMVRSNPEALGNKSYFKEISLKELRGEAAASAIEVFRTGFDKSPEEPRVYSVKVVSVSGKELGFQFFEFGDHHWGMWCNKKCNPDSRFMILNMDKKPNK
ncbi:MAG: hypothetical protein FHK78_16540 [Sedimenticola selenatireducens]|uniref:Uncharacterized protein n=1 Tax=Sedimenticola selenatireducens TaxID=191960 RepID=A0A557RY36_9GAMM|nr:hypothetical protein FHP88_17345 [Sedimenticola selenatireducens]TVT61741.1 MAG: hypothetical protein FHK78_16540 [Sedimenticola selenatireducens]